MPSPLSSHNRPHVVSCPYGTFMAPWDSQTPFPPWRLGSWDAKVPSSLEAHMALSALCFPQRKFWPQEIQARSPVAEKSAGPSPPQWSCCACGFTSLGAQSCPSPLIPLHRYQGRQEPHNIMSTGTVSHHGGVAVYVVRDLPAPCLLGLLFRLPQAAI